MDKQLSDLFTTVKQDKSLFSKYLNPKDGETFVGRYKGFTEGFGKFGPTIQYLFDVEGIEKTLTKPKTSTTLLKTLIDADINVGDLVKVTRYGEKSTTSYRIVKLNIFMNPGEIQLEQENEKSVADIFKK